jgi:LytS/YehU family sensor histidine kinase
MLQVMRDDDAPLDGGLHTMTDSDIEQFRAERDKRHTKAANPKYKFQVSTHSLFNTLVCIAGMYVSSCASSSCSLRYEILVLLVLMQLA